MTDKGDWESIQKYMAQHGHKIERTSASPMSKFPRTEASASTSMPMDFSSNSDVPSSSFSKVTVPTTLGSQPPFDGDNLSELLRQETVKNEKLNFQMRAFTDSSATWIEEKRHLNEALRQKLEENNILQVSVRQEAEKVSFLTAEKDDLATQLDELMRYG